MHGNMWFNHLFGRARMMIVLKILTLLSALWALLPPASYGVMFLLLLNWSVLLDFLVSASCVVLAISAFRRIQIGIWSLFLAIPGLIMAAGLLLDFRTAGESGPLPFEWIAGYAPHAIPVLLISIAVRMYQNRQAEHGTRGNRGHAPLSAFAD